MSALLSHLSDHFQPAVAPKSRSHRHRWWLALALLSGACSTAPPRPATLEPGLPEVSVETTVTPEKASEPARALVPSVSLGRPNAGALYQAVQVPEDPRLSLVAPQHAWGTQETVDAILDAVDAVHDAHEEAHPLHVGDLSREFGGPLYPHRSHQSGRDVDLGYYYQRGKAQWYRRASARTLDPARTWTLLEALITRSDVEYIFIDRSVQRLLHEHALASGADRDWLASVMQYKSTKPGPIIRHAYGHATHLHVRFHSPAALERGRDLYAEMTAQRLIRRHGHISEHRAEPGDTLTDLAARYGTPAHHIARANRLQASELEPGKVLKIPRRGRIIPTLTVRVPPRPSPARSATSPRHAVAAGDR